MAGASAVTLSNHCMGPGPGRDRPELQAGVGGRFPHTSTLLSRERKGKGSLAAGPDRSSPTFCECYVS